MERSLLAKTLALSMTTEDAKAGIQCNSLVSALENVLEESSCSLTPRDCCPVETVTLPVSGGLCKNGIANHLLEFFQKQYYKRG